MHTVVDIFEPADFSLQELAFLRAHLKESPTVALHGTIPTGVSKEAITAALGRFRELDELAAARNVPWVGYEPIEDAIDRFIAYQEKCLAAQEFGEPRHPSQQTWDSTGAMTKGGIGADASEKVRNELLEDGTRIPFTVKLIDGKRRSKVWGQPKTPVNTSLDKITHADGILHCTICDKPIGSYDTARATSRIVNKVKAEARKHCMNAKSEISRHRAIANVPIA
jgi:hypothetical protein